MSSNPAISRENDRRRGRGAVPDTTSTNTAAQQQQHLQQHQAPATIIKGPIPDEELPPYACAYCGYHEDTKCVARCEDCGKWFCNGKGQLTASHIVAHLVRGKHKKIGFHADSDNGEDVLECYVCERKNIFDLGMAKGEDGAVIACREPCLHSGELREEGVDPSTWVSIIENRQIIADLCGVPNEATLRGERCRPINPREQQLIEDAWQIDNRLTAAQAIDLSTHQEAKRGGFKFVQAPKQFRDGKHLEYVFAPLINEEMNIMREIDNSFKVENIKIQWRQMHGRTIAAFSIATEFVHMMGVGRPIALTNEKTTEELQAILILTEQADEIGQTNMKCELLDRKNDSKGSGARKGLTDDFYSVTLVFNPIAYERQLKALDTFAKDGGRGKCCSPQVYSTFIGSRGPVASLKGVMPEDLNAPGIAQLNDTQHAAVKDVLLKPFSLIQGPPGTGKTTTTATIVYHLNRMFNRQILVCAPSNIAVDELAARVEKTGLRVVRLVARSREEIDTTVEHLTLHHLLEKRLTEAASNDRLRGLIAKRKEQGTLNQADYDQYMMLRKKVESQIIASADIICCTNSVAADKRLEEFAFRHVVIDESTQAQEAELLIPITLGAEQVILIGDHCQMGPVVMSRDAGQAGLQRTTFERLVTIGHKPHRLVIQYRMHPELSKFSSNCFYEGTLQNGVTADQRNATKCFPWPRPEIPFFFYHTTNGEELGSTGMSILNRREAMLAEQMVSLLIRNGVKPGDIGVVTPYEAQRNFLIQHLGRCTQHSQDVYRKVEVASVDSFQGREKDFVILSCVRSNDSRAIGFLKDWRRMNVALTRARRGVMVIGNANVLADDTTWNAYLLHCKSRNLIVAGSVMDLDVLNIDIPPPVKRRYGGISEETLALIRGNADDKDDEADPTNPNLRGDEPQKSTAGRR